MIGKNSEGEFYCSCSECGAELYGGVEDNFLEFVEWLKAEGWHIRKEDEEWLHLCPNCWEGS